MDTFSGTQPITLLAFIATIRETLRTICASEAADVRVLVYYLSDEAQDVQEEQLSSATDNPEEDLYGEISVCKWSDIIDALLRRFLTDDILKESYDGVTLTKQLPDEDEAGFEISLSECSRGYRNVFRKENIVKFYVSRPKNSVRIFVVQNVQLMPIAYSTNLAAVNQADMAIGRSKRALMEEQSGLDE